MTTKVVFTIPVFGGLPITESIVVTWIIMAALVLLSIIFVRNLRVENPGKVQLFLEMVIGALQNFFVDLMGESGKGYVPYLISTILFLGVSNLIGLLGFTPPTKDMNVTVALALISLVLVEYAGVRKKGVVGFLKSFAEPIPWILPLNLMEVVIRPLSLCMRLFGNIFGAFMIMTMVKVLVPLVIPIVFSFYFDIFDGLLQAYVFVFLTGLYIRESID